MNSFRHLNSENFMDGEYGAVWTTNWSKSRVTTWVYRLVMPQMCLQSNFEADRRHLSSVADYVRITKSLRSNAETQELEIMGNLLGSGRINCLSIAFNELQPGSPGGVRRSTSAR